MKAFINVILPIKILLVAMESPAFVWHLVRMAIWIQPVIYPNVFTYKTRSDYMAQHSARVWERTDNTPLRNFSRYSLIRQDLCILAEYIQ